MSKLDKDQVIEKFTKAYQTANGKAPEIEASGGWYKVDGGKNMRLAQLDELADELAGGASEAKEAAPAAAEKPAKKAEAKKPAPAKKKAAAKKTSGFSVKAFYAEQIKQQDENSRLPR